MPTSATGTSTSSRRHAGFTLIEVLVVVFIIGVLSAGALLSLGVVGGDRQLDTERDRLAALIDYVREQAQLQNREYGLRCYDKGYEFVVFDARAQAWVRVQDEKILRSRKIPAGLVMTVRIEGRPVVLPAEDKKDLTPQVMLFSSGDLNLFEVTVRRPESPQGFVIAPGSNDDSIEVRALTPADK